MASLTPVESLRVSAVLNEVSEKLGFLGSISPDVLSHRDELSALAGDEVTRIITEQRVLERRYEELITARSQLKGLSNKTRYKEIQTEIQHLNHALRESTKTLCRSLKENPDVGENLLKISLERERLLELFSKVGDELESGRFDSLVAHVQMEKESRMRMEEIVEREKTSAAKVAELTTALEQEKAARAREVGEKTAAIRAVKEELQKLKLETATRRKCAAREAEAGTAGKVRAFKHTEAEIEEKLKELAARRTTEALVHEQTVTFLKQRQEELTAQAAEWAEKFATDTEAKEAELKSLQTLREADLETLNELQARFDKDLAEEAAQRAEEERKAELARLKAVDDNKKRLAATLLQRVLGKAFKVHLELAASKKKKKGGGKKKGKKK